MAREKNDLVPVFKDGFVGKDVTFENSFGMVRVRLGGDSLTFNVNSNREIIKG